MEPVAWKPTAGFIVQGTSGATWEAVRSTPTGPADRSPDAPGQDLSEGDWADFDEKEGQPVALYAVEGRFQRQ